MTEQFIVWLNTGNNTYRVLAAAIVLSLIGAFAGAAVLP